MTEQTTEMKHAVLSVTILDELPSTVILEVGATAFLPHGPDIGEFAQSAAFYRGVTLESNLRLGRTMNEERFSRMMADSISQRRWGLPGKVVLGTALEALTRYLTENKVSRIWSQQGLAAWAVLDAYNRLRKLPPFDWRGIRETMTAFGMAGITRETWDKCMKRSIYNDPAELSWGLARALQHCLNEEDDDGPEGGDEPDAGARVVGDTTPHQPTGQGAHCEQVDGHC